MSKTPCRNYQASGRFVNHNTSNSCGMVCECKHEGDSRWLTDILNWYHSLPEDVRKLSPETVAKCLEILGKSLVDAVDAKIAALEAEGAGRG